MSRHSRQCLTSRRQIWRHLLLIATLLTLNAPSVANDSLGRLILSPQDRERLLHTRQGEVSGGSLETRQMTGELVRCGLARSRWSRDLANGEIREESGHWQPPPQAASDLGIQVSRNPRGQQITPTAARGGTPR